MSESIHELLTSNGFHPVTTGKPTYACPVCGAGPGSYQGGDRRGPLRVYRATGERNAGREMWKCHACDASGGRFALARHLDAVDTSTLEQTRSAAHAPAPGRASRIDVARAWSTIDADRVRWSTVLEAAVREWAPADVAGLVARLSAVAVPVDHLRGDAAKLSRWATATDRAVMVALHDAAGRVASCAGRASRASAHADRFRFFSSERAGVADGTLLTYGRAVDVASAAGPVVIVEGARDWITAHLWARRRGGVAIGARSCGELPAVAKLVADVLTHAERPCSTVDLVVIPHQGDRDDVGVRYMDRAVEHLRSRAVGRVRLVTVPTSPAPDGRNVGDLADLLKTATGADDLFELVDQLVEAAAVVVEAPIDLRDPDAGARLAGIASSVVDQAIHDPGALVVWAPVEGAGKTRTCLALLAEHARQGSTAVFVGRTHHLLDEAAAELGRLGVDDVDVAHLKGRPTLCMQATHLEQMGNQEGAADLRERLSQDRRGALCMSCNLRDVCPAMQAKPVAAGSLSLVTHERARRGLKMPKRAASLVIIDELCELVGQSSMSRDALASIVEAAGPRSRAWQADHPDVVAAVAKLVDCIDVVARRRAGPHGAAVPASAWVADLEAIGATGAARELCSPVQRDLFDPSGDELRELEPPPAAPPRAVLNGHEWRRDYADRAAWGFILTLSRRLARNADADLPELVVDRAGRWSLVTYQATRLADGPTILLDATARENMPRLQALARRSGRRLVIVENDVRVESPGVAVHLRTAAFSTSRLLDQGRPAPHAFALVRRVLLEASERLQAGGVLGVITHKPVAVALGADVGDLADLTRWARESLRLDLRLGWYGKDELGSNRFADVDGLLLLGDPAVNMNASASEARAVGADALTLWRSATRSRARQAAARGRSARRGAGLALLMYAGRDAPDVPGVAWAVHDLDRGRSLSDEAVAAMRLLRTIADAHGGLAPAVVRRLPALDGHADRKLRLWCESIGKARSWRSWSVAAVGARLTVWAPTREAAEAVARMTVQSQTLVPQRSGHNAGENVSAVDVARSTQSTSTAASTVSLMGIVAGPLRENGLRLHEPSRLPAGAPARRDASTRATGAASGTPRPGPRLHEHDQEGATA